MITTPSQAARFNVTRWTEDARRNSSYVVLGVSLALVLAGVALWQYVTTTPEWVYWTLVGVMVAVLVFMAVLLYVPAKTASAAGLIPDPAPMAEHGSGAAPMAASATAAPPPAFEPRVLTLRCGDCGTIFEVTDTGERPLYHTCPGCGAEGALRDEPMMAAPEAEADPAPYAEPLPTPAPIAAEPIPAAPPMKRIKLRCGGCKEVFSIDDSGERPLKRACPHCGRVGQIS